MIFIDTDVFVIDLRYQKDEKYTVNKDFLDKVRLSNMATTSVYNLLEICGILSFNLSQQQLYELYSYLPQRYNLKLTHTIHPKQQLPAITQGHVLEIMGRKASFGDSLIISAAKNISAQLTSFVSWNARHFEQHLSVPAITPPAFLADENH